LALGLLVFATTATAHDSPARVQVTATATRPAATLTTNTPDEALASFVAARALPFAGPCDQTRSPRDVGQVCERFVEARASDGMRAYLIGRTFSEFTTWVFVAVRGGQWMVVSDLPLDDSAIALVVPWPP
jgi:hypothetical protein